MAHISRYIRTLAPIFVLVTLALVIGAAGLQTDHASAGAETFIVTKEADTNDGSCDESDCSLREATIAANQVGALTVTGIPSRATIKLHAGHYTLVIDGTHENLSATGDLDITAAVSIVGDGPESTIVDGGARDTVIDVRPTGDLILSGVTVQNGKDTGTGGIFSDGPLVMSNVHVLNNKGLGTDSDDGGATGGVTVRFNATITDSLFMGNSVTGQSTAALYGQATSNITIKNTTFDGNSAEGKETTGAIGLNGDSLLDGVTVKNNTAKGVEPVAGFYNNGTSTVMNSTFNNNTATGQDGIGGVFNSFEMTMWDSTVDGNHAGNGGIGGILSPDEEGNLTLRRVKITNNAAGIEATGGIDVESPGYLGEVLIDHNTAMKQAVGGMAVFDSIVELHHVEISNNHVVEDATSGLFVSGGHAIVFDSWIHDNTADNLATGGAYATNGATMDLTRVAVTNNSVDGDSSTGGVGVYQATATLRNVTVSGNSAMGDSSGGVYVDTGTVTLDFVTIDNNTAGNANGVGGLTNFGTLSIANSIVGNNPGGDNCYDDNGALTSTGHNLDFGNTCGFNQPTDKHGIDPMLAELNFTGDAFSQTEALPPNSPAVNAAGDCALTEDQRVSPRPMGAACDMGAFELGTVTTIQREWGDLQCANGAGPEDALVLIAQGAGVADANPAGSPCPGVGDETYIDGWFLDIGWGDVDCSGLVTIADALEILRGYVDIGSMAATPCPAVGEMVRVG